MALRTLNTLDQRAPLSPEEEDSLTKRLLRGTIGSIAGAANILGTPGAMVNRALMGENPLMPLLSPWSGEHHRFGRDVLRHHGMVGPKDTWGNFGAGFAVDVATNPLTWLMPPKAALTPAGQLLKQAGLMKYVGRPLAGQGKMLGVPGRLAKVFGKELPIGKATARQTQTIQDMLKTSVPAWERAAAKTRLIQTGEAMGMTRQQIRELAKSQVLGGWGGVGMPLVGKTPWAVFGATGKPGPIAAGWAAGKDILSHGLRTSLPGRHARALFSATARGSTQAPIQETGHSYLQGLERAPIRGKQATMDMWRKAMAAGLADDMGVQTEAQRVAMIRLREAKTPEKLNEAIRTITASGDFQEDALRKFHRYYDQQRALELAEGAAWGSNVGELRDEFIARSPRFIPKAYLRKGDKARAAAELGQQVQLRSDPLRDIPRGQLAIEDLAHSLEGVTDRKETLARVKDWIAKEGVDPHYRSARQLKELARRSADAEKAVARESAGRAKLQAAIDARVQAGKPLTPKMKLDARTLERPFDPDAMRDSLLKRAAAKTPKHDRAKGITRIMSGLTEEAKAAGMYGNDPLVDEGIRLMMFERARLNAHWTQDVLRNPAVWSKEGGVTLGKLAKKLNLNPQTVAKNLGKSVNDTIDPIIARDLAKGIEKLKPPQSVEGLVKFMDNFTNFWKMSQTSVHLGFHTRNRVGSAIQAVLDKTFDPQSQQAVRAMRLGKPHKYWRSHPLVMQEAKRMRLDPKALTDADATRIAQELTWRFNAVPQMAGEHAARVGVTEPGIQRQFQSMLGDQPGRIKPATYKDVGSALAGKGTTWNPLKADYRGVGDTAHSTWAPAAAGDRAGAIIEMMNRAPSFWNLTRQGMSPEQAVRAVNLSQVSYAGHDYSPFVRDFLLRGVPFGKFQLGMIKKLGHELTTRPGGRHAAAIRLADRLQAHSAGGEPVPDWVAQQMAVKVGESPDGDPRYLTGFGLMHEPAVSYLQPNAKRLGMHLLSQLAPQVKVPLEMATGQTFFQSGPLGGRALEDLDPTVGRIGRMVQQRIAARKPIGQFQSEWAPAMEAPGTRAAEHLAANLPFSRVLSSARTAIDPRRGILERAMNIGSGFRTTIVSEPARDAQIRDTLAAAVRKHPGGGLMVLPFISARAKKHMTPEQLAEAEELMALQNVLVRRAKERSEKRKRGR